MHRGFDPSLRLRMTTVNVTEIGGEPIRSEVADNVLRRTRDERSLRATMGWAAYEAAKMEVTASMSTTSSMLQPRERSLTGQFNPEKMGPIARAPARRSTSL